MIKIVLDRCQPWRSRIATCRLCLEACPVEGCVSFTENTVSVNNSLCVDCGICTTVCPSGALAVDGLSDEELLSRLKACSGDKELFLRCSLGPQKGGASPAYLTTARLPCLAVLKESHLVSLAVSGVKKIYLDCSGCTWCAFESGGKTILKTVSQARTLLSKLGFEDRVEALDKPSGDGGKGSFFRDHVKEITPGPDYSRRELFTFFKERAVNTASEKIMGEKGKKAGKDSAHEASPAGRRTLLIESLKSLSLPAELWIKEEEFPVRSLGIRDSCVMCRRCESFCPTGAIERTEDEGETRLDFRIDKCAPCFQCAEFCPAGAIYYERTIDLKTLIDGQAVTLMKKKSTDCAECGRRFLPEVEKDGCPSCGKKKRLDNRILSILFGDDKGMRENKSGPEEL